MFIVSLAIFFICLIVISINPFCGLRVIRFPFVCIYYNTYTRILQ
nr:MAG TPA: hypothetical protein [Inoviridae sp.]